MKRPFIFINSAMSADGKISSIEHRQVRISGKADLARVDSLRAESDAIMVGVGTVLADDPGLRIKSKDLRQMRLEKGLTENPLRIVADSRAKTPATARIMGDGCLLAVTKFAAQERLEELKPRCEIIVCGGERVDLVELFARLAERGVERVMVEGGATLNWSLFNLGLVDEIYVYVGAMIIGGERAPTLADGAGFCRDFPKLKLRSAEQLDEGVLLKWKLEASDRRP